MPIYMKIPDVPGESLAAEYRDTIRVLDISWGLSRPGPPTAKPVFADIGITKAIDLATTELAKRAANGNSLGKCRIFNVLEGQPVREFQKITTWKTRVTSLSQTDNESGGPPIEAVTFSFDKIELIYRLFDQTGMPVGTKRFAWDLINDQSFPAGAAGDVG